MRMTLISPRIAVQKGDLLGSGVPYLPIELATLAAHLRSTGGEVRVVDLFGAAPGRLEDKGDHYLQGAPIEDYADDAAIQGAECLVLFAISFMSHRELLDIVRRLKAARPQCPIAVLENSQAVTGYSLQRTTDSFFGAGADVLICGEPHFNWDEIAAHAASPTQTPIPDNVISKAAPAGRPPRRRIEKRARYPVPAWDLFPLAGYWSLPYSHGPKSDRILPILTSRGCPYPCDFCVVPETNDRRWRPREASEVVDEILFLKDRFGVRDFQIEDLNPTLDRKRWADICHLLIDRRAGSRFYLASGTKAETVRLEDIPLMSEAGCRYLSISPESGSPKVMQAIGKPFDYDYGLELVRACQSNGIRTQACFLVGHAAETEDDFRRSRDYAKDLVRAGLDEIAVFIVAPFAGSAMHTRGDIALDDATRLDSFSPRGRADYAVCRRRRQMLLRLFFAEKLKRGLEIWAQGLRSLFGRPQTKMEKLPKRILCVRWLTLKLRLASISGASR